MIPVRRTKPNRPVTQNGMVPQKVFFAGPSAATATQVPPEQLFQDPTGKVQFEVSDENAKVKVQNMDQWPQGTVMTLKDILDHPEMYKTYPFLADMPVQALPQLNAGFTGLFTPPGPQGEPQMTSVATELMNFMDDPEAAADTIVSGKEGYLAVNPTYEYNEKPLPFAEGLLRTLIHEAQHAIDEREGMQYAGNARYYPNRPGEIRANLAENRIPMPQAERADSKDMVAREMREEGVYNLPSPKPGFSELIFGGLSPEELQQRLLQQRDAFARKRVRQ